MTYLNSPLTNQMTMLEWRLAEVIAGLGRSFIEHELYAGTVPTLYSIQCGVAVVSTPETKAAIYS